MSADTFATNNIDELHYLAAITANLCDDSVRQTYADWLDSRGDERSEFVRMLATSAQNLDSEPLPVAGSFSSVWSDIQGHSLFRTLIELELSDLLATISRVAKPCVLVETSKVPDREIAIGGSKFGGSPDMPATVQWPRWRSGPLGFIGQIDVSDLTYAVAAQNLPQSGLLSFFAYADPDGHPGEHGDTQVLHFATSQPLERREAPNDLGDGDDPYGDTSRNIVRPSCRLSYRQSWHLPRPGDKLADEFAEDLATLSRVDRYWELLDNLMGHDDGLMPRNRPGYSRHQLGGYQLCYRCDDPSPGPDWTPLASFSSDENLSWNWCDGDRLNVYILSEDLRNGSLRRAFGYAG